jgi:hypothetical protein
MSWMKHFADPFTDLIFINLSVLKYKFNIKSIKRYFSADLFTDLTPCRYQEAECMQITQYDKILLKRKFDMVSDISAYDFLNRFA